MPFVARKTLLALSALAGLGAVAAAGFVWSGVYNVAADDPHTRPVYALTEALRKRSIKARASKLQVPALNDPARIAQGAGNYEAMCTGCHLKPGTAGTELSRGLYPAPPDLTRQTVDAAEAFWVIKHGIKASGMPAWGKSMGDEYIWNMVAFVQELPKLDAAQYQALVARSGGHSHGGGETGDHPHAEGMTDHDEAAGAAHPHPAGEGDDHDPPASTVAKAAPEASPGTTHVHADGKRHVHAPEPAAAKAAPTLAAPSPQSASETKPAADPEPAEAMQHDHDHPH